LTRSIGVSNFNINRTKKLLKIAKIKPVVGESYCDARLDGADITDQVELSIQCPQPELVAWLKKNDILPCAYSPLGGTAGHDLRENAVVKKIADAHKVQGATILLSWLLKRGIVPLPKSVTPSRIEANFKSESGSPGDMQGVTDPQPST
jgi:diketogulonate reductase-like aldo/keto reductase